MIDAHLRPRAGTLSGFIPVLATLGRQTFQTLRLDGLNRVLNAGFAALANTDLATAFSKRHAFQQLPPGAKGSLQPLSTSSGRRSVRRSSMGSMNAAVDIKEKEETFRRSKLQTLCQTQ